MQPHACAGIIILHTVAPPLLLVHRAIDNHAIVICQESQGKGSREEVLMMHYQGSHIN